MATCPRCGGIYTTYPAISRRDNKTSVCPKCGTEEALIDYLLREAGNAPPQWAREVRFLRKLLKEAKGK